MNRNPWKTWIVMAACVVAMSMPTISEAQSRGWFGGNRGYSGGSNGYYPGFYNRYNYQNYGGFSTQPDGTTYSQPSYYENGVRVYPNTEYRSFYPGDGQTVIQSGGITQPYYYDRNGVRYYYQNNNIVQSSYSTSSMPSDPNAVTFTVRVPNANAEVWFDNHKTQQRGMERSFTSENLTPKYDYTYHIRAKWMENGRPVERTRDITVRAGQQQVVDFSMMGSDNQSNNRNRSGTDSGTQGDQNRNNNNNNNNNQNNAPSDLNRNSNPGDQGNRPPRSGDTQKKSDS